MELLKYSNNTDREVQGNMDSYIHSFMKKLEGKLHSIEAKTEVLTDGIKFDRIVKNTTHTGKNKLESFKLLRDGLVRVEKSNTSTIKIYWEVKLDTLIFLSILVGVFTALASGLSGSDLLLILITGLISSIVTYSIGYSMVKIKIDGLIETAN